ncbi:sensor histidine kinase [Klebsiella pneumoniae subsp. ozaenae]|uniref:Sensor histidine kinase n=1 Tax=Klebsiella pneumoniae subsp. ozaenae TaxID=574 RepID=A0A378B1Z4_KLEPO|nr:sensor histidine kinase [Klebsiella pneumoniae subsp. ozaenae]
MRFWPASLQSRLMALLFLALLLANTLTLSLLFYERMSSARSVMLGNLASDVAAWRSLTACRPLSGHNGCRSWRAAIIAICWTPGSAAITRTAGAPGTQRAPCRRR